MRNVQGGPLAVLSTAFAGSLLTISVHAAATDLHGQWVGNSQVEGARSVARTTLTLGASDAENSTLRIEGSTTCTLGRGKYATGSGDTLSLTFKQAIGGDACTRMATGTFKVRAGSKSRSLEFEASYPSADGGQNLRRGALSRYP